MIILSVNGQTCNRLWIFANYLADSLENGEIIYVLNPDITLKDYPELMNNELIKFPLYSEKIANIFGYKRYLKTINTVISNTLSIKFLSILKVIVFKNYINAPVGKHQSKFLRKHQSNLVEIFIPSKHITNEIDNCFSEKTKHGSTICGIHIRRGDYSTFFNGKYYYENEVYKFYMQQIKELYNNNITFFIASNENIDLCDFENFNCFKIDNSNGTKDLYGLSKCDIIIGPPSTYSGWASFVGNVKLYFIEEKFQPINKESFLHILQKWYL